MCFQHFKLPYLLSRNLKNGAKTQPTTRDEFVSPCSCRDQNDSATNETGGTNSNQKSKYTLSRKPSCKTKEAVLEPNQLPFSNDEGPCSDVYIPPHRRNEPIEKHESSFNRSISLNYSFEKKSTVNNKTMKGKRHSASKSKASSIQRNADKHFDGPLKNHIEDSIVTEQDISNTNIPVVFAVESNDQPHSNTSNESMEPLYKKKDRSSGKKNSGKKSYLLAAGKKIQRQETFEGGFELLGLESNEIINDQFNNSGKKGQQAEESLIVMASDRDQNDLENNHAHSPVTLDHFTDSKSTIGSKSWIGNGRGRGRGNSNSSSNFKIGSAQNYSQDGLSAESQYNPRMIRSTSHILPAAKNSLNVEQTFLSPNGDKLTQSSLSANNTPLRSIKPYQKKHQQQDMAVKQKYFVEKFCQFHTPFVDSHCHLDLTLWERHRWNKSYELFRKTKCGESYPPNYKGCVAVFAHPKYYESNPDRALWLISEEGVYGSLGCHPKCASQGAWSESLERTIRDMIKQAGSGKVVAIGECGLDYSQPYFAKESELQKSVFIAQIQMALDLNLPLVMHSRDASEDSFKILQEYIPFDYPVHHHCFTGSVEEMKNWHYAFPGMSFGFTPCVMHRNPKLQETIVEIPIDKLLLETDAPYFLPQAARPMPNLNEVSHPGFAVCVGDFIAKMRNVSPETIFQATRENTCRIYRTDFGMTFPDE